MLLSSLEGAAVTSVKIEGVAHEFTTLPGVQEDVTDIILNLKNLICTLHGEAPEIEVYLSKKGPGTVTAADIEAPADLEILNPNLEIAHLSGKGKFEIVLTIGRGRGYMPAELNRGEQHTIGVIPVDSISRPSAGSPTRSRQPASGSAPTTTSSASTSRPTARSTRRTRSPRRPRSSSASSRSSPTWRRSRASARPLEEVAEAPATHAMENFPIEGAASSASAPTTA